MSRPNTRNKNKRQRPDAVDSSSQILRKIHEANDVTDDDINQLFMIWKPVCQGCRVNSRDNPNCFCGLVPPVNGSRKSGLWQKTSEIILSLGPDPTLDRRDSDSTPAGLTNLGATCYANSILQCLYMNTAFREGVFSVEVDVLKQYPVLDQIARLFAQLHASKKSFVDSDAFVKTLELDNGVQQDTHEFLTLLLSLLERCLRHSGVYKAKTIVQDLFSGSVSHVTTCSKCGRDSEASSKVEDFYALELNVKGLKTLDASLNDYLSLEQLNGDNQYFCGSCNARVDATRCIKLRTLPPVITFQLKRCIFLPKTTAKKKITSSFSFPQVLDMGSRLAESSQNKLTYDLSAVLIHKGSAVNSGHYVAHIKDEKTGLWWEFDDEHVSELGKRPFNEASSSTPQSESNGTASSENITDVIQSGSSDCRSAIKSEVFSSSDAYMLMYSLRCDKQENHEGQKENPIDISKGKVDSVQQLKGGYLPLHLYEWINNMNAVFLESCKQYDLRKEKELSALTERRQEVRTILSEAAVQSLEEQYFWISTDWLRLWADTTLPPALDNTPLLCSHGKVLASKVNCMKRISELAWTKLESKFNGGPKLGKADYCRDCLMDGARMVVSSDSYRDRRTFMKSIANDVLSGKCEDGMYYISRAWLQQWIKRKNLDAPTEADAGPTNAITCNHGELMPEQAPGAKRIVVPENFWSFLVEDALKVMPEDASDCTCFPVDSSQCCHCTEELSEVACLEDSLRTLKVKQRQNHEKLATGKNIPLTPQSRYFLLPSPWLVQWRIYINMTGKNSSSAPEPERLDGVINTLKCKKHTRLLERLPELVCRRGSYFQKNPSTYKLTIIPELDWKYFCEESGGLMENGVSALIDLETHSSPDDNMDVDAQQLILRASPEVLETSLAIFLDTTDKVLANGMFSHSDRSPIAQFFEKSRLCIQSVKLHSERKGVTVNTHVIEPQDLVELFTMLSSGWGMGGMKDLLLVNLRGNDQIIVQAFKEYCEQLGADACIKMFKSYDGLPGASGSAPLAFLEDFIKGLILSARPLLPVEPFEMEFYYTMVERAAVKAYESASDQAAEVDEISYALMEKVDCLMQNLENMEVKIGEGCQLPDRDQAAVKAYKSACEADEADEVSYALMEKVDCLMQNL